MRRWADSLLGMVALSLAGCQRSEPAVNTGPPALVCPTNLRLGTQVRGDQVEGLFEVANGGGATLVMERFRKSCNCSAVEVEENGVFSVRESAHVPPGGKRRLRMRLMVEGPPGGIMRQRLGFSTNDPKHPTAEVEFLVERILGTATAEPEKFDFDRVLVGTPVTRLIDIRDPAESPRQVRGIEVSHPAIRVERVEPKPDEKGMNKSGWLVLRLAVTVDTSRPGPVEGMIRVGMADEGRAPLSIGVSGRVEPAVTCLPGDVFLPRRSQAGPVYKAVVRLQPFAGKIMDVKVQAAPAGISVEPKVADIETLVMIILDPDKFPRGADEAQRLVRLAVQIEDRVHEVVIPVIHVH